MLFIALFSGHCCLPGAGLLTSSCPLLCPGPVRPLASPFSLLLLCGREHCSWGKPASSLCTLQCPLSSLSAAHLRGTHAHPGGPAHAALPPQNTGRSPSFSCSPTPSNGFKPQPKAPGSKQSPPGLLTPEPWPFPAPRPARQLDAQGQEVPWQLGVLPEDESPPSHRGSLWGEGAPVNCSLSRRSKK